MGRTVYLPTMKTIMPSTIHGSVNIAGNHGSVMGNFRFFFEHGKISRDSKNGDLRFHVSEKLSFDESLAAGHFFVAIFGAPRFITRVGVSQKWIRNISWFHKPEGLANPSVMYPIPMPSMYGIFTYIWLIFMVNVEKYTIHGCYGIDMMRAEKAESSWKWTWIFFVWPVKHKNNEESNWSVLITTHLYQVLYTKNVCMDLANYNNSPVWNYALPNAI